ncbi:MAG: hypothetical protein HQM14_01020 [SAR324 cluster bacterium]|nr:hypothetical protein [SAR324 cluster bacterium]
MNLQIKKAFERYCNSKNVAPTSIEEMEPLFHEFLGSLSSDLTRTFYLNGFSRIKVVLPDVFYPLQNLLTKLTKLQDPILKELRDQKASIPPNRLTMLKGNLQLYNLCRNKTLQSFQDNPSVDSLDNLLMAFDPEHWQQEVSRIESSSQVCDSVYNQLLKQFLSDARKVGKQVSALEKTQVETLVKHLMSLAYNFSRRGEMGIELTELALAGRLSFLCYAEMLKKPEEQLVNSLKSSLVISQWDWLHDHKLLQRELFLALRKQGAENIEKELNQRVELIRLLSQLFQNKWIDPRQIEGILKNTYNQPASKPLESLQVFVMKKEVGRLVQVKAQGASDRNEIMVRLSTLMKSNEALKVFYSELLGDATTLEDRAVDLSIDVIRELLGTSDKAEPATQSTTPPKKDAPFQKLRNKILSKSEDEGGPSAGELLGPILSDPAAILKKINELQQKILATADVMDEIMSNRYEKDEAIEFLEDKHILLPETEQLFRRRLQILQKNVKEGNSTDGDPGTILQGLELEIEDGLTLDTQIYKLQETLKKYEGNMALTPEEASMIKNMDLAMKERLFLVDVCYQKYNLLHELKSSVEDTDRLEELHLEEISAILLYVVQDILLENPYSFSRDELISLQNYLSPSSQKVEMNRQATKDLFDSAIGGALLAKILCWGFWKIEESKQKEIKDQILRSLDSDNKSEAKWKKFRSVAVSRKVLDRFIKEIPSNVEAIIDHQGKKIINQFKNILVQEDKNSIKNASQKDVQYLANALITTEYVSKAKNLMEGLITIEKNAPKPNQEDLRLPSDLSSSIESILDMRIYDQRLEMLIDELMAVLPKDAAIVKEGCRLYKEFTGFEY